MLGVDGEAVLGALGESVGVDGAAGDAVLFSGVLLLGGAVLLGGMGVAVALVARGAVVGAGAAARGCRDSASSLLLSSSSCVESVLTDAVRASTR